MCKWKRFTTNIATNSCQWYLHVFWKIVSAQLKNIYKINVCKFCIDSTDIALEFKTKVQKVIQKYQSIDKYSTLSTHSKLLQHKPLAHVVQDNIKLIA